MIGLRLTNCVALVTGAASGIGAAVVRRMSEEGARVVGFDRAPAPGDAPPAALHVTGDVTQTADVERAVALTLERFGRLDAVVCCAGITADDLLWKLDDARWQKVLDVNLTGSFRVVKAAIPPMRKQGSGSIVLMASILALRGGFGSSNYAASKAGVIALAKSAAQETGAFGIRVNAVAPGYIRTPMTAALPAAATEQARQASALGRLGEPDEAADAILFLCSPLSRYITGTTLRVDGGQCMGG